MARLSPLFPGFCSRRLSSTILHFPQAQRSHRFIPPWNLFSECSRYHDTRDGVLAPTCLAPGVQPWRRQYHRMPGPTRDHGRILRVPHNRQHVGSGTVGSPQTARISLRWCERGTCPLCAGCGDREFKVDSRAGDSCMFCSLRVEVSKAAPPTAFVVCRRAQLRIWQDNFRTGFDDQTPNIDMSGKSIP